MTARSGGPARSGSIRNLLFLLLLIVLVPVLLVQAAIYYREFQLAREDEFQSNLEVARAAAGLFESYLRDVHREELAVGDAMLQFTPFSLARANSFLTRVDNQYPPIAALSWIDAGGRVIASSIPKLIGQDMEGAAWFREAASTRSVVVTNLTRSSVPEGNTFTVASGIKDDQGVVRGVVAAVLDPSKMAEWLKIDRARSGAFSIIDGSGWMVYRYPPVRMEFDQRDWGKLYAPIREALQGKESKSEIFATYENRQRFISTTPIRSIGWAAGAGRPTAEAIAPIRQQITRDAVVVTAASLFALFVAAMIARRITGRVRRLSEYAVSLGQGKFQDRVEESGPGEMVSLARALNQMAGELHLRDQERERLLQVERERAENASLLEAIQEHAQVYLAYLDLDLRCVRVNNAYCERTGLTREQLIGRPCEEVFGQPQVVDALKRVRDTGEAARLPELVPHLTQFPGSVFYWDWAAAPVRDEYGSVYGIVVSAVDVSEQVRAREERVAAERMRAEFAETVASEINHRMKNNLVLLSSVLQMQLATQPPGSPAAAQLRDAITRISSISVVHEHLYADQPGMVELKDILGRIGEIATGIFSRGDVEFSVTGDTVYASSKVGTTIATVANELITNAIKHGAPEADGRLRISVDLSRQRDKLRLAVWNSQNPIPPGFDVSKQQGMGLRLVDGVVSGQLKGTFVLSPYNDGTLAEVMLDARMLDTDAGVRGRDEKGVAPTGM
jgi:PAS domain S-box-containing protein